MPPGFQDRLRARAQAAGVQVAAPLAARLQGYYDLLFRWNRTINLTALSDSDAAIDRLLVEPIIAAGVLPRSSRIMDLGSGGGSPAVPLALALGAPRLVMVESRMRKAAFLREALRETGVMGVVEAERFEDLAGRPDYAASMDVVTMRAVKMDDPTLAIARSFVRPGGRVALFTTIEAEVEFPTALSTPLLARGRLVQFDVPRGTG